MSPKNEYKTKSALLKIFSNKRKPKRVNKNRLTSPHPLMLDSFFNGEIIDYKKLNAGALTKEKMSGIKFFKCDFIDCDLTFNWFFMCTFQDCTFDRCDFDRTVFRKCQFENCVYLNISESYLTETIFDSCVGLDGLHISGTDTTGVLFSKCYLSDATFQANFTLRERIKYLPDKYKTVDDQNFLESDEIIDDLVFSECTIEFANFRTMEFIDSRFIECSIQKCAFSDCVLYPYTISNSNKKSGWGTNSIDLDSLKRSEIDNEVLKTLFNISPQQYRKIMEAVIDNPFSSVFISYSFKDAGFAKLLNDELRKRNVSTFLWQSDAPGGRRLPEIMRSNIDAKDRLLFIASEHSIKSAACQFELTQGRLKSDKLWQTILFPIHVDNFLFDIQFDQIRPKSKAQEYWDNIVELRDINSLDFSKFKLSDHIGEIEMNKLMESLRTSFENANRKVSPTTKYFASEE
jgi:uncharacterized protein YjbI with pentapeptide repeats